MPQIIKWPERGLYRAIARAFAEKGFPDTIGAIDGSHIKIKAPKEDEASYVNRKKYHSIVIQAVCREDLTFTDIFVGFPGSVHDSRILKNSPLYQRGRTECGDKHLIGDRGYPLLTWLMVAWKDNGHLNNDQKIFNRKLSSSRQVIKQSFGLLKGRCRRLQYVDVQDLYFLSELISVCCVLHNIYSS